MLIGVRSGAIHTVSRLNIERQNSISNGRIQILPLGHQPRSDLQEAELDSVGMKRIKVTQLI